MKPLETPEAMAERCFPNEPARHLPIAANAIRARDEQIATMLDAVVAAHPLFDGSALAREVRAIAAALRGAK